jgi:hypothetical protein
MSPTPGPQWSPRQLDPLQSDQSQVEDAPQTQNPKYSCNKKKGIFVFYSVLWVDPFHFDVEWIRTKTKKIPTLFLKFFQ